VDKSLRIKLPFPHRERELLCFLCIMVAMKREEVIRILQKQKDELAEKFGVASLQLFGSVARDEASAVSDVDLLVEFNRPIGYFGLFALQDYLETVLGCSVDLGTSDSLRPRIKENVMKDALYVA
jgi:uncharacterized protein